MPDDNEATTHGDQYHRHGEPDSSKWDEADAVTGRPVDVAGANSTFADRAKAGTKQVDSSEVEDKTVRKAPAKSAPKKAK